MVFFKGSKWGFQPACLPFTTTLQYLFLSFSQVMEIPEPEVHTSNQWRNCTLQSFKAMGRQISWKMHCRPFDGKWIGIKLYSLLKLMNQSAFSSSVRTVVLSQLNCEKFLTVLFKEYCPKFWPKELSLNDITPFTFLQIFISQVAKSVCPCEDSFYDWH